ncbi:MAG: DUF4342 domain-containing protein [Candidatus Saganbacteria bacterium]|nr:DUF4342 domain-containing protein [Candidatus Saganbacteria bacterium]
MAEEAKKDLTEEIKIEGKQLLEKTKDLIHQGNVREIMIKDKKGNIIIAIPVTLGVIGAVVAPILAAVGAVAAIVTECSITVKRRAK